MMKETMEAEQLYSQPSEQEGVMQKKLYGKLWREGWKAQTWKGEQAPKRGAANRSRIRATYENRIYCNLSRLDG